MGVGLVFATGGVGSFAGSIVAERLAERFGPGPTMIGAQVAKPAMDHSGPAPWR